MILTDLITRFLQLIRSLWSSTYHPPVSTASLMRTTNGANQLLEFIIFEFGFRLKIYCPLTLLTYRLRSRQTLCELAKAYTSVLFVTSQACGSPQHSKITNGVKNIYKRPYGISIAFFVLDKTLYLMSFGYQGEFKENIQDYLEK